MPASYPALLDELATGARLIADSLFEPAAADTANRVLSALATRTAAVPASSSLSAMVLLGQIRSTLVDLVMLTGVSYEEARDLVPLRPDGLDET